MGLHTPEEPAEPIFHAPVGPSLGSAVGLSVLVLLLLLANGRPIEGAGPTPALLAALASPVFLLARALFALDATGTALAAKVAASLFSALGAGALFLAAGRRHAEEDAALAALLFAFGTPVWAASQALYPQAASAFLICLVVLFMVKAEHSPPWAGRAGLPLGLAAAVNPEAWALVAVLLLGLAARWPRRLPFLLLWSLPGATLVLFLPPGPSPSRVEPGLLDLLASPAQGLLVFAPLAAVAAVGLGRVFVRGERALAATLGAGAVAHWLQVGLAHGGPWGWGPVALTDALPVLFLFLPEGLSVLPRVGGVLAVISVAVQALGAFAFDHRWEELHQPLRAPLLWDAASSPIVFEVRERVIRPALPMIRGGRAFVCEHPLVLFGPVGSRVAFGGEEMVVTGAEPLLSDVHPEGGARVGEGRLHLNRPGDALFLRVRPHAQKRRLELRIAGRGHGTLWVGESTFWSEVPRRASYPLDGTFKVRHPYYFPESGGDDLTIGLRTEGSAELQTIALVPPGEPENVIRLP